jgi:photosynthetic reaction center H subunit
MLTSSIDVAQVVLYAFWFFFAGLIFWLRKEDRREGYPLESDNPRRVARKEQPLMFAAPKTFKLPDGGEYVAPDFARDSREIKAERTSPAAGSPLEPVGDPMLANVGPASYAQRHDVPEVTIDGRDQVVPMRIDPEMTMFAGPDPRGWSVVGGDGQSPGKVKDIWVDRADVMVRYLEVELAEGGSRLIPMPMIQLRATSRKVEVSSIFGAHFAKVPTLKNPNQVTILEEEKISAFYAGGRLYAAPNRLGPLL